MPTSARFDEAAACAHSVELTVFAVLSPSTGDSHSRPYLHASGLQLAWNATHVLTMRAPTVVDIGVHMLRSFNPLTVTRAYGGR